MTTLLSKPLQDGRLLVIEADLHGAEWRALLSIIPPSHGLRALPMPTEIKRAVSVEELREWVGQLTADDLRDIVEGHSS